MGDSIPEQIRPELTWRLRHEVLYPDQPWYTMGMDEDEHGYHFGVFDDQQLIAVVSLFQKGTDYQFRKFAVKKAYQHRGIGTQLLNFMIEFAQIGGGKRLWCNARLSATGFYQKQGFAVDDEPFVRNGIEYVIMSKAI